MIKPKKSLSQNFINDKNICKKIVNLSSIVNKEIIEIGPGYGFLTDFIIAKKPKKMTLIEKDNVIYNFLIKKYNNKKNLKIINADVLKHDFKNYKNAIIISNLPYNISSQIILKLFKTSNNLSEMIFMIQKEMALKFDYNIDKLNKYKFLNRIICKYKRCFNVSSKVFFPMPKVESTVVKFEVRNNLNIDWKKIDIFVSKIFKNKRKKISNNLKFKNLNVDPILQKRIDQIKINDLLRIYNSF